METSNNTRASGDNGDDNNGQHQSNPMTRSSEINPTSPASKQLDAHPANQFQGFNIDLTNLDDSTDTKSTIGMLNNSPYVVGNGLCHPFAGGMGGMMEQNFFNSVDAVPTFEPETPGPHSLDLTQGMALPNSYHSFEMTTIPKFDSQAPEPANNNAGFDLYQSQYFAQTSTPASQAIPAPIHQFSRGATEAPQAEIDHVPPNRIPEAGPVPHPDRDWRPYGTNHWHVFLGSPETLKYLSTSEIKEIREHCYQLSKALDADGNPTNAVLLIPDTAYTTTDAQTVWKHCDAYIRRRGQLRNNNAARRSRQRKEAELKYWKKKALEYGCPDHEFVWDGREVTPPPSANAYASTPAGPQTRARTRQTRPSRGRGLRRANTAARDESVAASQDVPDFNQPNWS